MSWTEIMMSKPLFQNAFILRKPRGANLADIMIIVTMFITKTFKDSKKVERITNYVVLEYSVYPYFLI